MANPTVAQAKQTWLDVIEVIHDRILGVGTSFITDAQDVITNYKGDQPERVLRALADSRRALIAAMAPAKQMYLDAFRDYCRAVSPVIDIDRLGIIEATRLFRMYQDDTGPYAGGSISAKVTARAWTRGSAASPTSTQIIQLLTDEFTQAIEDGYAGVNTVRVTSATGADPVVSFIGGRVGNDVWDQELTQAGLATPLDLPLISDRNDGGSLVTNHILANVGTTTDAAAITQAPTGWTHTVAANSWVVESTAASLYRGLTTVLRTGSSASAHTISQIFTRKASRVPYVPAILCKNDASWQGAFTLAWGSKSQQFTHADMSSSWGWIFADRDQDLWERNWEQDAAALTFTYDTATANTFLVGALGFYPLKRHRGSGRWMQGFCQDPDPLYDAGTTITDTIDGSTEGMIQQVHHLMCNLIGNDGSYLCTTGATLTADP